jgi:hypothetical protein
MSRDHWKRAFGPKSEESVSKAISESLWEVEKLGRLTCFGVGVNAETQSGSRVGIHNLPIKVGP